MPFPVHTAAIGRHHSPLGHHACIPPAGEATSLPAPARECLPNQVKTPPHRTRRTASACAMLPAFPAQSADCSAFRAAFRCGNADDPACPRRCGGFPAIAAPDESVPIGGGRNKNAECPTATGIHFPSSQPFTGHSTRQSIIHRDLVVTIAACHSYLRLALNMYRIKQLIGRCIAQLTVMTEHD